MRIVKSGAIVLGASLAAFAARATAGGVSAARAAEGHVVLLPPPPASASESARRERDLALFSERAAADPLSAADRSKLAELYLARSRETGSVRDVERAERAARASLALRDGHNTRTRQLLASALLAQHRFGEALAEAQRLAVGAPEVPAFRALLGECQLEVGDYAGADTTFAPLARSPRSLAVTPRIARWHELSGRPEAARGLLRWARDEARRSGDGVTQEQRAWFEFRLGDFELRRGNLEAAEASFQAAIAAHPNDYRVLGGIARLELQRGHLAAAIEAGERTVATVLDPATLGVLADAHALAGDSAESRQYVRALEAAVLKQPGAYHRAWSLWFLDHDRNVARVAAKVRAELRTRKDIYGLDLYAWSLHKLGRNADASRVMTQALSRGSDDPMLARHSQEIERALAEHR